MVGNREDEHILRDVCEYIDKLKSQYNDLAESNDEIVYLLSQTEVCVQQQTCGIRLQKSVANTEGPFNSTVATGDAVKRDSCLCHGRTLERGVSWAVFFTGHFEQAVKS